MAIWIDTPKDGWCHLSGSDIKELKAFAQKVGIKKHYFEYSNNGVPHFDVRSYMIGIIVKNGAKLVKRKQFHVLTTKYRIKHKQEQNNVKIVKGFDAERHLMAIALKKGIKYNQTHKIPHK